MDADPPLALRMCLRPPNPKNFSDLWIVLNMCKWDLGKVRAHGTVQPATLARPLTAVPAGCCR